jgi:uncharacterized protein YciI
MFLVLYRFSKNKSKAPEFMSAHNAWSRRAFDEGMFVFAGSLEPQMGGVIVAQAATRAELERRIHEDPFVVHDVVTSELLEVSPTRADPRLAFLNG